MDQVLAPVAASVEPPRLVAPPAAVVVPPLVGFSAPISRRGPCSRQIPSWHHPMPAGRAETVHHYAARWVLTWLACRLRAGPRASTSSRRTASSVHILPPSQRTMRPACRRQTPTLR